MNRFNFTCFFITFLFMIGCSEKSYSVNISECLDDEPSMINVKDTVDKDVETDDVDSVNENENSSDVAKVISLENDLMIIELTSDFNCSDAITYTIENRLDGNTLLIDIRSNHDGPVTVCMCMKTITLEVREKMHLLDKIEKIKFKLPDTDEYRDALFYK